MFANNSSVLSQNLSFDQLVNLQKSSKKSINNFLIKNTWKNDAKLNYVWLFGKTQNADSAESMLVLRDFNCTENIIYYIISDTAKFNEIKTKSLKKSFKNNTIEYSNIKIEDHSLANLNIRFYESHFKNQLPLYALWIFSKNDDWYFEDLNALCFNNKKTEDDEDIFTENNEPIFTKINVEKSPEFPGGDERMMTYLRYNLIYPTQAREKGIYGTVYVSFVIEANGSITNIKILRGIGGGCDEEVIQLIKNMPRWTPGTQNNKPVRVLFNMPIKFTLS
jgi:TonB family protein